MKHKKKTLKTKKLSGNTYDPASESKYARKKKQQAKG